MGNEVSSVDFEGPPEVLEGRDIPSLAKYIKSDECKNIFVMVSQVCTNECVLAVLTKRCAVGCR